MISFLGILAEGWVSWSGPRRNSRISTDSSGVTRSSASSWSIQSWAAKPSARFRCTEKSPGQGAKATFAPSSRATAGVPSVLPESTTTISRANRAEAMHSRILFRSLFVRIRTVRAGVSPTGIPGPKQRPPHGAEEVLHHVPVVGVDDPVDAIPRVPAVHRDLLQGHLPVRAHGFRPGVEPVPRKDGLPQVHATGDAEEPDPEIVIHAVREGAVEPSRLVERLPAGEGRRLRDGGVPPVQELREVHVGIRAHLEDPVLLVDEGHPPVDDPRFRVSRERPRHPLQGSGKEDVVGTDPGHVLPGGLPETLDDRVRLPAVGLAEPTGEVRLVPPDDLP